MIRKLKSGEYRLYSRKRTSRPASAAISEPFHMEKAKEHERAVQYFKRH